jgi:uncharacterized protein YecE (DUF72 family)
MPPFPHQSAPPVRIGTAGWPLPASERAAFPAGASLLERYAGRFNAVEINSSFYRSHRRETYRRWADTVPDDFAFSAKLPREITHKKRLIDCEAQIDAFVSETAGLGRKFKLALVQLPPSLRHEPEAAARFFEILRGRMDQRIVCEPRHPSWFTDEAEATFRTLGIARVAADPEPAAGAGEPAGAGHTAYVRLHGAPRMYYSAYDSDALRLIASRIVQYRKAGAGAEAWCIFDNTAQFAATPNALELMRILAGLESD